MDYFLLQLQTSGIKIKFPMSGNKTVVEPLKVVEAISFFESHDYTELSMEYHFRPAMKHFSTILMIPETFSLDYMDENDNNPKFGISGRDEAILELVSVYKGFYNIFIRRSPCDKKRIPMLITRTLTYQVFDKLIRTKNMMERKWMRQIIYAIYRDCIPLRPYVRSQISDVLHISVHENEFFDVVPILLGLMDCLIKGFVSPIKEENKKMVLNTILPLYKSAQVERYHESLYACLESFIGLDASHIHIVLERMALMWPTGAQKQVMYISSMDRLLDAAFIKFSVPMGAVIPNVALILNKGLMSPSSLVTDESLNFLWRNLITDSTWHDGYINSYLAKLNEVVMVHWNSNTRIQAERCLRSLEAMAQIRRQNQPEE